MGRFAGGSPQVAKAPLKPQMRTEIVTTLAGLEALGPAWRRLLSDSGSDLPFLSWEWAVSWWRHLASRRVRVSDALFVHAVWAGDALIAIAPLMITERPSVGPVRLRCAQMIGADPAVTELRGVLCAAGQEPEAHAALFESLRQASDRFHWLDWSGVRAGSSEEAMLASAGATFEPASTPDFVLPLPPTWTELKAGLKRNLKESLRKCYNAPARDGRQLKFSVSRTPAEVLAALPTFLRLHAARADLTDGVRHSDVFASAVSKAFLTELLGRLAEVGAVRLYQLDVDGAPAAVRIGFVQNRRLYLYYSGYEPALARYSVMTTATAEAIQSAIAEGLQSANLSPGEDVSKTRWGPARIDYRSATLASGSLGSRLLTRAWQSARAGLLHPKVAPTLRSMLGR